MSFRVRIWCSDCGGGADPMGCFDGGYDYLDETFDTAEAAEEAGGDWAKGAPYEWAVEPMPVKSADDRSKA